MPASSLTSEHSVIILMGSMTREFPVGVDGVVGVSVDGEASSLTEPVFSSPAELSGVEGVSTGVGAGVCGVVVVVCSSSEPEFVLLSSWVGVFVLVGEFVISSFVESWTSSESFIACSSGE